MPQFDESYVNMLKELISSQHEEIKVLQVAYNNLLVRMKQLDEQIYLRWSWDSKVINAVGEQVRMKLDGFVMDLMMQGYKISDVVIPEYDETGSALNAIIIAIRPKNSQNEI